MSSKKADERNEKIIRGLLKLPPNRKCINCNGLAPQYVCTNFWTFICIACSGIHREYTHRVKSISMAKFTKEEVEALQRGGNQRARELFLKEWDMQRMRFPDSSNPDKIREFIKSVYVDKKFAGGKSFEKPPRDMQNLHYYEEDHRRASSYHSFSQSPPYEHQYEERRYGKQSGALTRRPGSDHGLSEGNISSFMYSPGRLRDRMSEDRFANESTSSRISDLSVYSAGDPSKFGFQSPNFQESGYSSPPSRQVRDILIQDGRSQSSNANPNIKEESNGKLLSFKVRPPGSFGSFDSNSVSLKSVTSGSLADFLESDFPSKMYQPEASIPPSSSHPSYPPLPNHDLFNTPYVHPPLAFVPAIDLFAISHQSSSITSPELMGSVQQPVASIPPTSIQSSSSHFVNHDLFNVSSVQQPLTPSPSLDMFVNVNNQTSSTPNSKNKLQTASQSANEGWATFDIPQNFEANVRKTAPLHSKLDRNNDSAGASQLSTNNIQFSAQSKTVGSPLFIADQRHVVIMEAEKTSDLREAKLYGASEDLFSSDGSRTVFGALSLNDESRDPGHKQPESSDKTAFNLQESWDAFDALPSGGIPLSSFGLFPLNNESTCMEHKQPDSRDKVAFNIKEGLGIKQPESSEKAAFSLQEVSNLDELKKYPQDAKVPDFTVSFNGMRSSQVGNAEDHKSTNPFDFPFESAVEANNMFMDFSSLGSELPNPQLSSSFFNDDLPEQWFPQSSVGPYISPVHQGLTYMGGQMMPSSHLPNLPSQGHVASLGGNPFA